MSAKNRKFHLQRYFVTKLNIVSASDLVQHRVGGLVAGEGLLAEVLVGLGQALHLGEARVERHRGVVGVLRQVQVGRAPQLLLDH